MGATGGIIFRINECIADVPPEKKWLMTGQGNFKSQ